MEKYEMIRIKEHEELKEQAAEWFHQKWKIPKKAYLESMEECLKNETAVPQWYIVRDGRKIMAGNFYAWYKVRVSQI